MFDEFLDNFFVRLAHCPFKNEIFASDQFAGADEEHLHAGFAVIAGNRNHIRVNLLVADDLLFFHHPLNGMYLIAQGGCPLKTQFFGGLLHLFTQTVHYWGGAPFQEFAQVVDHLPVGCLINRANARAAAQLDVIIQAGTLILTGDDAVAGQVGKMRRSTSRV